MIEEYTARLQACMYQYSRAIYRSIKDRIDPYVPADVITKPSSVTEIPVMPTCTSAIGFATGPTPASAFSAPSARGILDSSSSSPSERG